MRVLFGGGPLFIYSKIIGRFRKIAKLKLINDDASDELEPIRTFVTEMPIIGVYN